MRLYAVSRSFERTAAPTYRGTWIYQHFFHGDVERHALNIHGRPPYRERHLVRNAALTPELFFVPGAMVVGPAVAAALRSVPHVDLVPAHVTRLYSYPVDEASVLRILAAMSPLRDDFYEWLDQTTAAYGRRGWPRYELHEVVVPMLALLAKETIGDKDIVLPNPVAGGERTVGGKTSTALHERHPIVECNPYYIMVEAVFEWMRPHVCVDECFTVVPIEI